MVRIRLSCWKGARLLPPEARASHSPGALLFLCPSERTILSMRVLPQQCCSRPPFLARLTLPPARSDGAMGLASKHGLADVDHGPVLWVRDGTAEYLMGDGRDVALTQYEKAQQVTDRVA